MKSKNSSIIYFNILIYNFLHLLNEQFTARIEEQRRTENQKSKEHVILKNKNKKWNKKDDDRMKIKKGMKTMKTFLSF